MEGGRTERLPSIRNAGSAMLESPTRGGSTSPTTDLSQLAGLGPSTKRSTQLSRLIVASAMQSVKPQTATPPRSPVPTSPQQSVVARRSHSAGESNPFTVPSDEDIFLMRARETKEKESERERAKTMKIWEKTIHTSAGDSHKFKDTLALIRKRVVKPTSPPALFPTGHRREKENIAEFIAKKRDMFLIQMSLDTKKEEIKKLEEKAKMKEEALRKSELMLEDDALRFDAFLKEQDKKAHDALKRADRETKLKQEKISEIKKLSQEISKVESEMSKYEERLGYCLKYKKFLDMLTPPEHLQKIKRQREQREAARKRAIENGDEPPDEVLEEMYFQEPQQLLDIFAQLEERNLFLIQNVQETEEALEELKQKFKETEDKMEQKTSQLRANIEELTRKIKAENDKAEHLTHRTRSSFTAGSQYALLQQLADKVTETYIKCGFDPSDADPLDMLRQIEGRLESLLNKMTLMDPEVLARAEKEKETERRDRVRQEKYREQQRQDEERLAKSNARAHAEVHKKVGKQLMFRSAPIKKKQEVQETSVKKDEGAEDLKKFFT